MLNEKNFAAALKAMNFTEDGNTYKKIFADNVVMEADFNTKKLSYPAQIKGRDRNTELDDSHKENLVVFECVNRLLDKGYKPEDIELERTWQLGHEQKSGRADICVSSGDKTLFIIECKTYGAEYKSELANMQTDGGQLFSYWQQEQSCQWLELYASDYKDGEIKFEASSVFCGEDIYRDAHTVEERFKAWSKRHDKNFLSDVIFHDETRAYQIGVRPLRKCYLKDFDDTSLVNNFEEILRHNAVSDKENAFNRLLALFICKLADEYQTDDRALVKFQFEELSDTHETFQDRLQRLYRDGMKKFMGEDIFYLPEDYPERLFENFRNEENNNKVQDLKDNFRKLKFYTNNAFAFVEVNNEKLFRLNAKVLVEVVNILRDYRIIGSKDLQTLGDLFEQLLNKGFKQDAGQFFTPTPIAQFIWDSLPLDKIISDEPPKIIDYACGAGHFLTEGFRAVNDFYARKNLTPPVMWERDKLFGVEKDYRLARVSKISLFMHGADEGKIKFGDGLENYPDENIKPATFDILVANPPYSVKGFKAHLKLANENFDVLDKISNSGSEIETLFTERIAQLIKARGVAAVILPSSILNKDGKSFIAARESLLKNFYVRTVVQLGSKTFGATGTNTVILFLERFNEPPRMTADFEDVAESILHGLPLGRQFSRDIFNGYTKKIGVALEDYKRFISREVDFDKWDVPYFAAYASTFSPITAKNISDAEKLRRNNQKFYDAVNKIEREKIIYFGLTYRQTTLIISAPEDNKEQEKFLGYGWSNAKGREGIIIKKRGGFLFDNDNRDAENTLAAVIRAAYRGERLNLRGLDKYYSYVTLADMLDFDAANFTKTIKLVKSDYEPVEYSGDFPLARLGDLITQIRGVSYEPNDLHPDLNPESLLLLRANNIGDGKINHDKVQFVSRKKVSESQIIREGDILMCGSSGSLEHVGKVALCNASVAGETFGAFCKVIRSNGELLSEYAAIYLSSPDYRKIIANVATGSNIKNLKNEHINDLKIPLPPADIQRQIVDEFKAIAAQIESVDETIKNLDVDIKNKFAELFMGRGFTAKHRIDTLFNLQIGKTPARDNHDYWNNGIHKWISVGDLGRYDRFTGETAEKISQSAVDETGIKIVPANTVIMSFKLTIGRTAITSEAIYTNEAIVAFLSKTDLINADYLRIYLRGHDWSRGQMRAVKGLTLNKQSIGQSIIPVPPLELQEQFASYVKNCEALKQSARVRREKLLAEREKLVNKYFR